MQSFYQFYQKRLQESSDNTNNLFIEIFDRANLDDVTTDYGTNSAFYEFKDNVDGEDYYYKIIIHGSKINKNAYSYDQAANFLNKYDDLYSQFKIKYPKSFDTAEITLKIIKDGVSSYKASNLGNHVFVYSKLLACIQDAISKYKPLFLDFSGAENSMDLVYDKFIKMSQSAYPQDAYVPYKGYYIRKEVYDLITNDDSLEFYKKKRESYLKNVRVQKNREKAIVMARKNMPDDGENMWPQPQAISPLTDVFPLPVSPSPWPPWP